MPSKPIPGSTGEVLTCLPSPYLAHGPTGLLYLPRFLAKCKYVKARGSLPASYAKNFKRGIDGLPRLLPADVRAAKWNRDLAQKGMTDEGREFLKAALTAMGCADRAGDIR